MKTLVLLPLCLAVALGMPAPAPGVAQNPVLTEEDQHPLLGDELPAQGHVVVDDPQPQVKPGSEEQQEKLDMGQRQSVVEPEVKVKPEAGGEQQGGEKTEVKKEPELKENTEAKDEPEVKVEQELKEVKAESEDEVVPEVEAMPEVKLVPEANVEPEVMAKLEVIMKQEVEKEQELEDDLDFKVESEVKVEPEPDVDMEEKYGMKDTPITELEQVDDDNMFGDELSDTEKSLSGAVQNQESVMPPLPDEEPVMEPEMEQEQFVPDAANMEEGPALDVMGQQMQNLEEYFPNEEARLGMKLGSLAVKGSDYSMMEEPGSEFVREEEEMSPVVGMPPFEEPAKKNSPVHDGGVQTGVVPQREIRALMRQGVKNPIGHTLSLRQDKQATRQSCCPGVLLEGKCYQFFKGPKRAEDAEFFCQAVAPGGHLASISSQHIHREVMRMMLRINGAYTRTWVGGLRYLGTGRFIWLDGSHWSYADWLSGEPNDTSGVEDCVEVLPSGNGKFNDFTCWEPQAFICSYPYQ